MAMAFRSSSGCLETWNVAVSKFGTWIFGTSTKVPTASSTCCSTRSTGTRKIERILTHFWSLLSVFLVPNSVNNFRIIKNILSYSASLLFWDNRQKRHHCFQENMMRGGRFEDGEDPIQVVIFIVTSTNLFQTMVATSNRDDRTSEDIVKIVINKGSIQRVRHWKPHFYNSLSL